MHCEGDMHMKQMNLIWFDLQGCNRDTSFYASIDSTLEGGAFDIIGCIDRALFGLTDE